MTRRRQTLARSLQAALCLLLWAVIEGRVAAQIGPPPIIVVSPTDQVTPLGGTARFGVTVQSGTPVTYRWYHNGELIPGASGATLSVANAHWTDVGRYAVAVQNASGSMMSSLAALALTNVPLCLTSAKLGIEGFRLSANGPLSSRYVVEACSDFVNWIPISTNTAMGGQIEFNDPAASSTATRVYRSRVLESLLERNASGTRAGDVKKGTLVSQSFRNGAPGGPVYWIRTVVLNLSCREDRPDSDLKVSIGTGLYSNPLPGGSTTVSPTAITNLTDGATFQRVEIGFDKPVGPLVSGTTYYVNLECSAPNGRSIVFECAPDDVYACGTYFRNDGDTSRDVWFEIWGN